MTKRALGKFHGMLWPHLSSSEKGNLRSLFDNRLIMNPPLDCQRVRVKTGGLIPTIIARKRQRSMKVLSVVQWSVAAPRTGYSKSAHAAHGLGGETHLPSKPPHTLTRKGVVLSRDFHRNARSEEEHWIPLTLTLTPILSQRERIGVRVSISHL